MLQTAQSLSTIISHLQGLDMQWRRNPAKGFQIPALQGEASIYLISSTDPCNKHILSERNGCKSRRTLAPSSSVLWMWHALNFQGTKLAAKAESWGPQLSWKGWLQLKHSDAEAHTHPRFPQTTLIFHSHAAGKTGHCLLHKLPVEAVDLACSSAQAKWHWWGENQRNTDFFLCCPEHPSSRAHPIHWHGVLMPPPPS